MKETKNVIIIDDSKSKYKLSEKFNFIANNEVNLDKCFFVKRQDKDIKFSPNEDALKIDYNYLVNSF